MVERCNNANGHIISIFIVITAYKQTNCSTGWNVAVTSHIPYKPAYDARINSYPVHFAFATSGCQRSFNKQAPAGPPAGSRGQGLTER